MITRRTAMLGGLLATGAGLSARAYENPPARSSAPISVKGDGSVLVSPPFKAAILLPGDEAVRAFGDIQPMRRIKGSWLVEIRLEGQRHAVLRAARQFNRRTTYDSSYKISPAKYWRLKAQALDLYRVETAPTAPRTASPSGEEWTVEALCTDGSLSIVQIASVPGHAEPVSYYEDECGDDGLATHGVSQLLQSVARRYL